MSGRFLVIDIGCLECGIPSSPIGTYGTREEAEAAVLDEGYMPEAPDDRTWNGSGKVVWFDLDTECVK